MAGRHQPEEGADSPRALRSVRKVYSETNFIVYEPVDDSSDDNNVYAETDGTQWKMEQEFEEKLQELFKPYGMVVEMEK